MVDKFGRARLIDFGIAEDLKAGVTKPRYDYSGTRHYSSPEQLLGEPLTPRSEVYSLGVTLLEILIREDPLLPGDNDALVLEDFAALQRIVPEETSVPYKIPAELRRIAQKALNLDPALRYANAGEMADDLGRYLIDTEKKSHPSRFAVGVTVAALMTGALFTGDFLRGRADQESMSANNRLFDLVSSGFECVKSEPGKLPEVLLELENLIQDSRSSNNVEMQEKALQWHGRLLDQLETNQKVLSSSAR